jgi:hypothetical protein
MRYVLRMLAVAVVLLIENLSVAAPTDAKNSNILFAVRDYTHSGITYSGAGESIRTLVEPIAFIVDGHLVKPPDEVDAETFAKSYYANSRKYTLYSGGRSAGSIDIVKTAFDIQCEGLGAIASVTPADKVSGMRMALASDAVFPDASYLRRAATAMEREVAVNLAMRVYSLNNVPPELAAKLEVRNLTVFEGKTDSILVGSLLVGERKSEGDDEITTGHAVFLIAERGSDGKYESTLTWFHSGSESDWETQDLVDILNVDGSGSPQIITQFGYYESVEYHVYKRERGQWQDVYQNSGAGC